MSIKQKKKKKEDPFLYYFLFFSLLGCTKASRNSFFFKGSFVNGHWFSSNKHSHTTNTTHKHYKFSHSKFSCKHTKIWSRLPLRKSGTESYSCIQQSISNCTELWSDMILRLWGKAYDSSWLIGGNAKAGPSVRKWKWWKKRGKSWMIIRCKMCKWRNEALIWVQTLHCKYACHVALSKHHQTIDAKMDAMTYTDHSYR